mmetsp:Transcript_87022/g.244013  ORF Transcript_87022/g.244013 Transcript_87022/m.244013 type:complete len:263 (+) Transcript_87022:2693-3481(+)
MVQSILAQRVDGSEDRLGAMAELLQVYEHLAEHAGLYGVDQHVPAAPVKHVQVRAAPDQVNEYTSVLAVHGQHNWRCSLTIVCVDARLGLQQQVRHVPIVGLESTVQGRAQETILRIHSRTDLYKHFGDFQVHVASGVEKRTPTILVDCPGVRVRCKQPAHGVLVAITGCIDQRCLTLVVHLVDIHHSCGQEPIHDNELDAVWKIRVQRIRVCGSGRWTTVLRTPLYLCLHFRLLLKIQGSSATALLAICLGDEIDKEELRR